MQINFSQNASENPVLILEDVEFSRNPDVVIKSNLGRSKSEKDEKIFLAKVNKGQF